MATRFEVVLTHDGIYCFQLRGAAGDLLLRGLGSPSKIMTQNEIQHLRNALKEATSIVPHEGPDGRHFVVVKDHDGSVLARSRLAADERELDELIGEIVAAAGAAMIDLTKQRSQAAS